MINNLILQARNRGICDDYLSDLLQGKLEAQEEKMLTLAAGAVIVHEQGQRNCRTQTQNCSWVYSFSHLAFQHNILAFVQKSLLNIDCSFARTNQECTAQAYIMCSGPGQLRLSLQTVSESPYRTHLRLMPNIEWQEKRNMQLSCHPIASFRWRRCV